MDFSELRHARERLGLSLGDIADRTKIRATILGAIENNETDRLPPPIFTRGFVRVYAREVGLDPGRFVEPSTNSEPPVASAPGDYFGDAGYEDRSDQYNLSERETSSLATAALIVVAGLLFIITDPWTSSAPTAEGTAATAAEATATHGTAVDAAVATAGAVASVTRPPNMRLELVPHGPCWVEATADGERVIYKLLDAGDRYAIEGYEDLVLKVGDPAALAYSLNGAAGRQLGPAGQPATVHITRENSREFTQS